MAVALPVAVGVRFYDDQVPWPGVLVEWKSYRDRRGLPQWWGLVTYAMPSLSSPAAPFALRVEWVYGAHLVGLPASRIYPQREEAPGS